MKIEGEMAPVAYMCYAQSPVNCATWSVDTVRSNVESLLGPATPGDKVIVIVDTSGEHIQLHAITPQQ